MKLYNIDNTRCFFEKLASCRGEIEFVDRESGNRTPLQKQGIQESILPISMVRGKINEIELIFHDHQDSENLFLWALNKCGMEQHN